MSEDHKIVLIKRRTRLEELTVRYNTVQQARFSIERLGADFDDYAREDATYRAALAEAVAVLETCGRVQVVDREHVPNYLFGPRDTVVALGQDGLVAGSLKYVTEQPLIGVNPDPARWDGILLPFTVRDLRRVVPEAQRGRRPVKEVTLAKAKLNDGQCLYGVNDLFIGRKTHVSARYELRLEARTERHSSSGIIVSTGLGATGWLRSVLAGAAGIARLAAGAQPAAARAATGGGRGYDGGDAQGSGEHGGGEARAAWDADELRFTVREPFPSRTTGASLVYGRITAGQPLRIVSQMPEDGVIFSDGVESDFLEFNAGIQAVIGPAEKKGRLVV